MADGIFDQDELKAAEATESTEVQIEQQQGAERADEAAETAEQEAERARDERGRFAAKEGEEKDRKVDHGAFHKEREQRKHWEGEAKKAQEQLAAIAALRERVSQAQTQAQPATQAAPAQTDGQQQPDPLAALRTELDGVKSTLHQREQTEQRQQIDQYEAQTLGAALTQAEAEFKTRQPDYHEATNHLIQARAQELQFYGYSVPEIQQTLAQEALEMTRMAIQQGRSPAELAYQVAQARGYRPQQQQQGGGVATIDAIIAGQKAGKSVGGAAGAGTSGAGDVNAATLANMSEAEFDRLYQTPEGRRLIDSLS